MTESVSIGSPPQSKKHMESQRKALKQLQKTAFGSKLPTSSNEPLVRNMSDEERANHFAMRGLAFEVWTPKSKKSADQQQEQHSTSPSVSTD